MFLLNIFVIIMKLRAEQQKDRIILYMEKNHTIANLLRKTLWELGVEAGYDKGHPYIGESVLVIKSKDAKKDLERALAKIKNDLKEFKVEFEKTVK